MRFLADMGVSQRVTEWLRANGHDAVHLTDRGLQRLRDAKILETAALESRIILTFDLDFGEIVALSGERKVSTIVFRLNNTTTPFVIQRLDAVLRGAKDALETGVIVAVEDARYRTRRLPVND